MTVSTTYLIFPYACMLVIIYSFSGLPAQMPYFMLKDRKPLYPLSPSVTSCSSDVSMKNSDDESHRDQFDPGNNPVMAFLKFSKMDPYQ